MNSKENASAWDKFHFQVKNTTEDLLGVQNRPRLHFIRGDVPSSATFPPKINKETHLNVTHRRTPQCCCAVGRKGTVPAHPYRFPGRKRHPETTPGRYREYQLTISLEIAWEIRASLFSFRGGQQQGIVHQQLWNCISLAGGSTFSVACVLTSPPANSENRFDRFINFRFEKTSFRPRLTSQPRCQVLEGCVMATSCVADDWTTIVQCQA